MALAQVGSLQSLDHIVNLLILIGEQVIDDHVGGKNLLAELLRALH